MAIGVKEYLETINGLSAMYDYFNEKLFNGELIKPVITINPIERDKKYGWLTKDKLWAKPENGDTMYELNISAQFLDRPISEIAATLLHEMCHQWSRVNGFQDTARLDSFHNKLFREVAENHGLKAYVTERHGWSDAVLNARGEELLAAFLAEKPLELMYRARQIKPKRVRDVSVRKYVCPDCKASVRATKSVNVWCGNCKTQFQEEKI